MPQTPRRFVWWSDDESRKNQTVSILAIVETVLAVALYWWIAIAWDCHFLLLSSLFAAPLLLLRSEKSVEKGVEWFLADQFDFESYEKWTRAKQHKWKAIVVVVVFVSVGYLSYQLAQLLLVDESGVTLFLFGVLIGAVVGFTFSYALTILGAGASTAAAENVGIATPLFLTAVSISAAAVSSFIFVGESVGIVVVGLSIVPLAWPSIAVTVADIASSAGLALGWVVRAISSRIVATSRYPVEGAKSLPKNWFENSFVIDFTTDPELLPGIRHRKSIFTLSGMRKKSRKENNIWFRYAFYPIATILFFLPALLYRLHIKATCWLYWPLFYLLRPALTKDTTEMRRRELCFPLSNPIQALIVGLSIVWFAISLLHIDQLKQITGWTGAPVYWEYLLIMDWSSLKLWDWAHLVTAVTGVGMIWIAGNALGSYRNKVDYSEERPSMVKAMTGLRRTRTLAVIAALGIALGSVVINLKPELVEEYVPVWAEGIQGFYSVDNMQN